MSTASAQPASLWEASPLPYQSIDISGVLLDVNSLWCDFTGYTREEVIGREFQSLVPADHEDDFTQAFAKMAREGELNGQDCFITLKSGAVRNISIYGRLVGEGDARVSNCMLVDVTEHRVVAAALVDSEQHFRGLFELAPNPIVVHDGRLIAMANAAAAEFLGYGSSEDLVGVAVADLVHSDTAGEVAQRVSRMMAEDWTAPLIEEKFVRKDGAIAYGETVATPVVVDGRRMIHVAATDLCERRKAEGALAESETRFQQLFECSVDAIIVHNGVDVFLANRAAHIQFGFPLGQDVRGFHLMHFVHPEEVDLVTRRLEVLVRGEQSMGPVELRLLRVDGSIWHAEATSSWLSFGGDMAVQTTFRDLTTRRRTEQELALYQNQLEELVAERTASLNRARAELDSITAVIARVVELRDPYTAGHQRRVAELSVAIAKGMGMTADAIDTVQVAAAMHDIGKISIPAEILSKPGRFSPAEFELVKEHSQAGFEILASTEIAFEVAEMIYQHHERLDGSGYPRGLVEDQLLLGSCVLMVSDVVEAISSHRPYRPAKGLEAALGEIMSGRGTRYHGEVVDACVAVFERGFEFSTEE